MRVLHLILALVCLSFCTGCGKEIKVTYSPSFKDDPVRKVFVIEKLRKTDPVGAECLERGIPWDEYYEEYDRKFKEEFKDYPFPGGNGNWIPSRDGPEKSDTIVDGYEYNRV